jgi:phosphate transport system permease protein
MATQDTRKKQNQRVGRILYTISILPILLAVAILISLIIKSYPLIARYKIWPLITGTIWKPMQGLFGYWPFILGTFWVTVVGVGISIPICFFTTIYLTEYAHSPIKKAFKPLLDILAAIPSVVYGVWGMIAIVPWVEKSLSPFLSSNFGFLPIFISSNPTGFSIIAGGIVLAVMITPFIIAISSEVMSSIPQGLREASLSLGSTRWETIRYVLLPKVVPGLIAAVVLGASRAVGETMAVLMVVGNMAQIPKSIFDAAYPLPALIANNYGEMMSIPMYDAALMGAALILLIIILVFNIVSQLILRRFTNEKATIWKRNGTEETLLN